MKLVCNILVFTIFLTSALSEIAKAQVQKETAITPSITNESKEPPKTLGSFKRQFLNQEIILNDVPFEENYCLQWSTAQQMPDGNYKEIDAIPNNLPLRYKGQTAKVIVVELAESFLQRAAVGETNAFGESIGEEDISDPYMKIVIKLSDGTLALTRGYTATLVPEEMELASSRLLVKDKIESMLPSVVGQKLYAVGFSKLYRPTTTVQELTGDEELLARLPVTTIPFLAPLTITKAKYLSDINAVLLKVSLPDGSDAIVYTPSSAFNFDDPKSGGFLAGISGTLLTSVPTNLSPREIDAIKHIELFRGMSKDALDYALGFPDKENDWGRGGKQRVYFNGKLIVYLNNLDKVEDWQSFD